MLAREIITDTIEAVSGTDRALSVLERMDDLLVSHLPVVADDQYAGLISRKDLSDPLRQEETIGDRHIAYAKLSVAAEQHIYEAIDLVSRHKLTLLPVVGVNGRYQGCILLPGLIDQLSLLTSAGQIGAILVLVLALQDYSPAILARIIEENNAKIISLYAVPDANGRDLTVTIRVNTQETASIIRSFDRHGFPVTDHFLADSQLDDFYRSRYEEFLKYMSI